MQKESTKKQSVISRFARPVQFTRLLMALLVVVFVSACTGSNPDQQAKNIPGKSPSLETFDVIITAAFFQTESGKMPPPAFTSESSVDSRTYQADYYREGKEAGHILSCSVMVAPAGSLLDATQHKRKRVQYAKLYADRDPVFMAREFPPIGSRAQREMMGAGPGGSAYGLVFTTSDERFDVRLTLTQRLGEGIDPPKIDINALARRLDDSYNKFTDSR